RLGTGRPTTSAGPASSPLPRAARSAVRTAPGDGAARPRTPRTARRPSGRTRRIPPEAAGRRPRSRPCERSWAQPGSCAVPSAGHVRRAVDDGTARPPVWTLARQGRIGGAAVHQAPRGTVAFIELTAGGGEHERAFTASRGQGRDALDGRDHL